MLSLLSLFLCEIYFILCIVGFNHFCQNLKLNISRPVELEFSPAVIEGCDVVNQDIEHQVVFVLFFDFRNEVYPQ